MPSVEGLDWLKEKGYKTFLDLRQGAEVEPTFAESVNDRGMVYISLPILVNRLEPTRLARFNDLIARTGDRPLYFCDSDGTRAGLVWYLHLRAVVGEDVQAAAPKAEEIGLTAAQLKIAESYLATHRPRAKVALGSPAVSAAAAQEPPPPPAVATAAEAVGHSAPVPPQDTSSRELPEPPVQVPAESASTSTSPPLPMLPNAGGPRASTSPIRDVATWRPIAALILAGVGVPLAYLSRSALGAARTSIRRASLPAAERRSLGAPAPSDA